jgi:hypothetical protein
VPIISSFKIGAIIIDAIQQRNRFSKFSHLQASGTTSKTPPRYRAALQTGNHRQDHYQKSLLPEFHRYIASESRQLGPRVFATPHVLDIVQSTYTIGYSLAVLNVLVRSTTSSWKSSRANVDLHRISYVPGTCLRDGMTAAERSFEELRAETTSIEW